MGIDDHLQDAVVRHAQADMARSPSMWVDAPKGHERKIGEGALAAMGRMGHDEITHVLPAFPDSIQPQEEPGALGTVTPQMATDQMGYDHKAYLDSVAAQHVAPPSQQMESAQVSQDVGTVWGHDAYLDQVAAQHVAPPSQQMEIE